jgi:hypothetical protein
MLPTGDYAAHPGLGPKHAQPRGSDEWLEAGIRSIGYY